MSQAELVAIAGQAWLIGWWTDAIGKAILICVITHRNSIRVAYPYRLRLVRET